MRRRHVTIGDIAQQSDASIATVSMVLRDKPGISAATRTRVLEVARELGYQRRTSPATSGPQTGNVAMIVRSRSRSREETLPTVNAFYSWVITGIESAAQRHRMNLLYATLPVDDVNQPLTMPEHLLSQPLAGMLLIGSFAPETIELISASRATSIVLVDGPSAPTRHDAVVSDNEGGAHDAVLHLIAKGHREIAMIGPEPRMDPNFSLRQQGYLRAIREHGLPECLIRVGSEGPNELTGALKRAFAERPRLTAIFGCNDAFTIDAMRALQAMGRRVPDDVSVMGFDDITLADQISPRLTTMAVDKITMGRLAVLMLNHRLTWPESTRSLTVLPPELRVRESVRDRLPAK